MPLSSEDSAGRAIGTRVSHEVHSKVLNEGKSGSTGRMFTAVRTPLSADS